MALALVRFLVRIYSSQSVVDAENAAEKSLNVSFYEPYLSELFVVVCFVVGFIKLISYCMCVYC